MDKLRKKRNLLIRVIPVLVVLLLLLSAAGAENAPFPYLRFDSGSRSAWQKPLRNVRFLTGEAYQLTPLSPEKLELYGLRPDASPDTKGLDTLNISGSAQFSENHFRELAAELRERAGGKEIYVFDLRSESHALLSGIAVSWCGENNWENKGLTLEEVQADEAERFSAMVGTVVTAWNGRGKSADIDVSSWMTEKELVESEGFHYVRFPCLDHCWPDDEYVEQFFDFVQGLDTENAWLHFHCQAGRGRTGVFMSIYDMIKNPDVPFEDIMLRQAMTGSAYIPYDDPGSDIAYVFALRSKRIRQVYDYIQEMNGSFTVPWREWVADK